MTRLNLITQLLKMSMQKNASGNKAAGSRARKALGEIKKLVTDYRKASVAGE